MRSIILFGYGRNGKSVAKYLNKREFLIVVYDENEKIQAENDGYLNVEFYDESILDDDLIEIGIKEANTAICMLEDEARNMFLALSIRNLNKSIKLIAKSNDREYEHRYKLAGVDQIINSYEITAHRIDSILKKPITLEFIHNIVFEDNSLVFAQIEILKNSFLDGKYLDEVELERNYDLIPIGIVDREKSDKLELVLENNKLDAGDILVVIGDTLEVDRIKNDMEEYIKWHSQ
jgi:voltage-gated potassium channel